VRGVHAAQARGRGNYIFTYSSLDSRFSVAADEAII